MRYLLVSDTHSNLEALRAVLEACDFDRFVFLGDAVDYGPDPEAVVDILKREAKDGGVLVRGNHDEAVAAARGDVDVRRWSDTALLTLEFTRDQLSSADRAFLGSLPLTAAVDLGAGGRALAFHGSPTDTLAYLWPEMGDDRTLAELGESARGFDAAWHGHTHLPSHRVVRGLPVSNPGSVGQPRDGDWRACCAVYDTETAGMTLMRVEYDLDRTVRKIHERGMPLADVLASILRGTGDFRAGVTR